MEPEWKNCGETPEAYGGLAEKVYNEIHFKPYPLLHLGSRLLPENAKVAYILIKNCHWLHEADVKDPQKQFCKERSAEPCHIKSAAYAVLDPATGQVYW
jgi:hypothetical protein